MRRACLKMRDNILKRYLVHVAAFNLSLVMRAILGVGTPRELRGRLRLALQALAAALRRLLADTCRMPAQVSAAWALPGGRASPAENGPFSTGC